MSSEEYSVAVFFTDGNWEYVARFVDAETAVHKAHGYTNPNRPANLLGLIDKVVITDGGDHTTFLWEKGKGIVFPTREQLAQSGVRQLS